MACNRETSTDGSTSSAPPACPTAEALVPCCNSNCHSLGCAATMNLCSRCYSEHILKEGGSVFLDKSSAATTIDAPIASEDTSLHMRCADVIPPADDQSGLRELSSSKDHSMNRSVGVSDLQAIFRSAQSASVGDMSSSALPQPQIPSPLSLPSRSPQAFSPVRPHVDKLPSMLPLPPRPQQAVSRCLTCRKRVGLLGFKCRCGDVFCALHRYSDKHDCSFDYKAAGRAAIAKENPVVRASKVVKI